jgi:hypothetical protein
VTNRYRSLARDWAIVLLAISPLATYRTGLAQVPRKTDVVVSVSSAAGEPIEDASVSTAPLGLTARTDWIGEAHLRGVPSGRYRLTVRRLGFTPSGIDVTVTGDTVGIFVSMTPAVIALDTLRVVAPAAAQWNLGAFERRKAMGIGRFLDDTLLDRRGAANLTLLLAEQLPGLWAVTDMARPGFYKLKSRRSTGSLKGGQSVCNVDVYMDGARFYDDVDTIRPLDLAGIELYSMGSAPVEYRTGSGSCQVLLLWLRYGKPIGR